MGKGILIKLWKDKWIRLESFAQKFPSLHENVNKKNIALADVGRWIEYRVASTENQPSKLVEA